MHIQILKTVQRKDLFPFSLSGTLANLTDVLSYCDKMNHPEMLGVTRTGEKPTKAAVFSLSCHTLLPSWVAWPHPHIVGVEVFLTGQQRTCNRWEQMWEPKDIVLLRFFLAYSFCFFSSMHTQHLILKYSNKIYWMPISNEYPENLGNFMFISRFSFYNWCFKVPIIQCQMQGH